MAINKINDIENLKLFNELGFKYDENLSENNNIVFVN